MERERERDIKMQDYRAARELRRSSAVTAPCGVGVFFRVFVAKTDRRKVCRIRKERKRVQEKENEGGKEKKK